MKGYKTISAAVAAHIYRSNKNYIGSYESCTTNELELSAHKNHIKLF